ncbi:sugar ABC transporter permease [Paenibacillus sp. PK4536]|uniref:Putative ABC transporter permease protein YurN n=1 Tax=Paenibacillus nuruki TaxID=1886670 RepID=A0A1E3LBD2_9BACL|nr:MULTISPECIES: sugar ABC transporter permease [Paenibacillus]ODP30485.1 putative ABC transporter permease protein YurN [Paenibacillus nuruki]TKJ85713.1 sugar ABC transporter permease [Paenibacillus sp. CFBP13512]WIM39660.1 sugar ABC transporter permease [Paenibacillus sp. PK4536]CAJ1311620.1 Sugar ABC transporter permease [Paenibacillus nuruki]
MTSRHWQRNVFILTFILPTLILYCLFMVYPIIQALYYSLFDWSGSSENKDFIGLKNFVDLMHDPIMWQAIGNDYFLVAGKMIGIMLLATFFAVSLTRFRLKFALFFRSIFFIPNIISVVVIGVLWAFIYNPQIGFLNSILSLITGTEVKTAWLGFPFHTIWMLLPPSIWAGIGFYMILLIAAIQGIPESYYEASSLEGAGQWHQFTHITLPLIWEQIKVSVLNIMMTTLNGSFVIVMIMTNGGPDNSTQVMGSYLYQMAFQQFHFGYGAAIGVVILIMSLITTVALQRIMRQETVEMN